MVRGNRGQVLVLVALAIFALLGLAALGIDVGYMYSVRHELQRSADAGALAGASAFITGDWNDTDNNLLANPLHPRAIAIIRAREYASKDNVVQTTLNPASEVAVSFPSQDRIEVITSRNADLFFARIFGPAWVNKFITARAVAEARVIGPNANVTCITPFAIPYPWVDNATANGLYDPGEHVYTSCEDGVGMCVGTAITLSVGSPSADNTSPSGQQSAGQFFLMQGNVGGETFQGANDLRNFIMDGCFSINMGLPVDLMPGNNMGPTVQAIEEVIRRADQGGFSQTYPDIDNTWEMTSPRVIRVVIYDPTYPIYGGGGGGTQGTGASVPVGYTLAGFWIDSVGRQGNNGWVTGRYIPGTAFADSTESGGTQTGTEIKVIALVE